MENRGKPWAGNSTVAGANNILLLAGTRRKKKAIKNVLGSFVLIWRISLCLCPGRLVFKRMSYRQRFSASAASVSCYYMQACPIISKPQKNWCLKTEELECRLSPGAVPQVNLWKTCISENLVWPPGIPPALSSDCKHSSWLRCLLCVPSCAAVL